MRANGVTIETLTPRFETAWEEYVMSHPDATLYHRLPWRAVIGKATSHQSHYLIALSGDRITGLLPLFIIRSKLFGNMGVSMPFHESGGILADDHGTGKALFDSARSLSREQGLDYLELRHLRPLSLPELRTANRKIIAALSLKGGAEEVFRKRFHQNVRNKIRKAERKGVSVRKGPDLLDSFYRVFSRNLRDLGTPVLGKRFFTETLTAFRKDAGIYVAVRSNRPIGAKLVLTFRDTMYFIWAGSIRSELDSAPVHAANWEAIRDACGQGLSFVNFGSSNIGSNHHSFKKYWGTETRPLHWQYYLNGGEKLPELHPENPKFALARSAWKRMPVFLSRLLGPPLAKNLP